jgi:hypothetical protein
MFASSGSLAVQYELILCIKYIMKVKTIASDRYGAIAGNNQHKRENTSL